MWQGHDFDKKKRRKKIAHDLNRGPIQKVTSYQLEYDDSNADHKLRQITFKKQGWYGDNYPLNNRNQYHDDYKGHYKGYAKRYKDHFDTLQTYPKIKLNKATANRHYEKTQNFKMSKGLYNLNKDFDRTTEQVKPCAKVNKRTEAESEFNSKNGEINSKKYTGKDTVAKYNIEQLMGGYYYD